MLSIRQIADQYGVCEKTVRRWISSGHIEAVRLGPRLIRVDADSVERLLSPIRGGGCA
ncbi:helix-turn-helix domain-containing protein [Mycolicibacillus trivialis]|nr:helix-turn-helix domain-containing protein [Mycolicibacillus trivialis]